VGGRLAAEGERVIWARGKESGGTLAVARNSYLLPPTSSSENVSMGLVIVDDASARYGRRWAGFAVIAFALHPPHRGLVVN